MVLSGQIGWRRSLSVLAAAIFVGMLITVPSPAGAQEPQPDRAATPAEADGGAGLLAIVAGTHRCEVIGRSGGYHGVHCATVDLFTNSSGQFAIRGRGQTFCQRDSDNREVPCRGAFTYVDIAVQADIREAQRNCGSYGGSACPSGRMTTYSPGMYRYCGVTYYAIVHSYIELPNGQEVSRLYWQSGPYTPTHNCIF